MAAALIALLPFAASATGKLHFIESRSGDYCRDELEDLLRSRFGEHVKVTSAIQLGQGEWWLMWAKTNLCDGWVVAKFVGERWNCRQGRYGYSPKTLVAAFGKEGTCKQIIPRSIYW